MNDFTISITKHPEGTLEADLIDPGGLPNPVPIVLPDDREAWAEVGQGNMNPGELAEMGQRLFDAIFCSGLRDKFNTAIGEQTSEGVLRLRFETEHDVLNEIPLEMLCMDISPMREFIALDRGFSIVRSPRIKAKADPDLKWPLRMLVVIGDYTLSGIDAEEEYASLETVLNPLINRGVLTVTVLQGTEASEDGLKAELNTRHREGNPYHFVHFIGHGQLAETPSGEIEGALKFVGADSREDPVYASVLASDLAGLDIVFVALHVCQGAAADAKNAFRGVAQRLIAKDIDAAIAMQWPVEKDVARTFFTTATGTWQVQQQRIQRGFFGHNPPLCLISI